MSKNYYKGDKISSRFYQENKKLLWEAQREQEQLTKKREVKNWLNCEDKPKKRKKKKRNKLNKPIGYVNYKEYIKSKRWRQRRYNYYLTHKKQCVICYSGGRIGLHHISYKNLGHEPDHDLVALCWSCHEKFHQENGTHKDLYEATNNFIIQEREDIFMGELTKRL